MASDLEIEELLNRALDGDLSREEMRHLFRLVATHPEIPRLMADFARVEEGLARWSAAVEEHSPSPAFSARLKQAVAREPRPQPLGPAARFFRWLRSPQGLALQPYSFAAGAAVVMILALGTASPVIYQFAGGSLGGARLKVHDVQLINAQQGQSQWTHQFIVQPGNAARLSLSTDGDQPVSFQFEAAEPTEMVVEHDAPGTSRDTTYSFTVHGIGHASLGNPQSGDAVTIRNKGRVPVLVYTQTVDAENSSVTSDSSPEGRTL